MDFIKDLSIDSIRNIAEDAFNQAKPKSDLEAKIYEVLSHKNWGSSSTLLNELAQFSYDFDKFPLITRLMWEGLDNRPAAWRVVFKALILLEHLIKHGSERCVDDARNHSHQLKGLGNFNYYEGTIDRGLGVREKSKQIIEILEDDGRIREERAKAKKLRDKLGGGNSSASSGGGGGSSSKYAGYGNDSNFSGGGGGSGYGNSSFSGGGGGGGYGNSGIDSSINSDRGFSGRYSDQDAAATPAASSSAPTFATLPAEKPRKSTKVKKLKKKKKRDVVVEEDEPHVTAPAPAAPAADMFSFESHHDSAPAAAPSAEDEFDAFASASQPTAVEEEFDAFASAPVSASAPASSAAFDAFASAPAPAAPAPASSAAFDAFASTPTPAIATSSSTTFDAFASAPAPSSSTAFDAFATAPAPSSSGGFDAFASTSQPAANNTMNTFGGTNNNMMMMQQQQMIMMQQHQQQQQMMNMMGSMSVNQNSKSNMGSVMGGGASMKNVQSTPAPANNDDDDFGDFSGAGSKKDATNVDPMSKLIQLDSLTVNKKKEDKTKQPILYNTAAATSMATQANRGPTLNPMHSFNGIDGLNKTVDISVKSSMSTNRQPGQPVMTGASIGLSAPAAGSGLASMGMNAQQQAMMMGMGGMQPNMMMMNNQMGGMTPNMMGGQMGGVQPNMMAMNNMMGGMGGGNGMMGGSNGAAGTKDKNAMGVMMGGQPMGGSVGGMGTSMGGQPMGGWQ